MAIIETEIDLDNIEVPEDQKIDPGKESGQVQVPDIQVEEPERPAAQPAARKKELPPGWSADDLQDYLSEAAQKRISQLTYERHEASRAASAYEAQAREAVTRLGTLVQENRRLQGFANVSGTALKGEAEARARAELEGARRRMKEANEQGDSDKLAQAAEDVAAARVALDRAQMLEPPPPAPAEEDDPRLQRQMPPQQNVDVPRPTQQVLAWAAKNPWFHKPGYEDMTALAYGTHERLLRQGVTPDSGEYYQTLDKQLRRAFPDYEWPDKEQRREAPSDRSAATASRSVVAPATRSSPGRGPRTVRLNETQLAVAKRLGLTKEQYAAHVLLLEENQ